MLRLQTMIEELNKRADDSDLIALLATSRQARLYNAHLARELRDVVGSLKAELDRRDALALCQSEAGSKSPCLIADPRYEGGGLT